jgi:glycosyltransferase involved in cell wall biosynthesis
LNLSATCLLESTELESISLKIAICIDQSSMGGVGTSTYILARGMRRAGHQADILATDAQIGPDYERARRDGWPVEAICAGERWLRRRLETTLERLSVYDVVVNNHSRETQLLMPSLPASVLRLSVIRSTDAPVIEDACFNSGYLDSLVGISPQVTELLLNAKVSSAVHTIPNAVLVANESLPDLSSPLQIIFVGRIEERQKNILILPDIARILMSKGLDFKLTVVGDGPHRRDLEVKIARMNLGNVIDMLGEMKRDAAWNIFCKAHLALLPSNFEGFGLVVAEAMAAGCVPIVSDIPVFRWILGEDAEHLTADVQSPSAYADRLVELASDPIKHKCLQNSLRNRQRENFTPEATVSEYLKLLEDLLKHRNRDRFTSVPLANLPLPKYYKRRCTRAWWLLQKMKYGALDPVHTDEQ